MEEYPKIYARIFSWVASDSAEAPLLLLSHREEDKMRASLFARQAAACTSPGTDHPCGTCKGCIQAQRGTHPNAYELLGENGSIKVKDITAVSGTFSRTAEKRVIAIPHAEHLLPEAANMLLKSLEEPLAHTRFFLCASAKRSVLQTIRSRCTILFAGSPPEQAGSIDTSALLAKLARLRPTDPFSDEELREISLLIRHMLREQGASPALFRVSMRLRDYHKTASSPGGNRKLAADILLASLAQLRNTMSTT